MVDEQIGRMLRGARETLGLSQKVLALRAGVSTRLWAEVERGQRPNVSLHTAVRMLAEVGVSVSLSGAGGVATVIRDANVERASRAARAAVRRATWAGRQILLAEEGSGETDPVAPLGRLSAVSRVSEQAYAVARATKQRAPARSAGKRVASRGR